MPARRAPPRGRRLVPAAAPARRRRTPLETVLAARPDLAELDAELHAVAERLGSPELAENLDRMSRVLSRQAELLERWEALGGPSLEAAAAVQIALGIGRRRSRPADPSLSGGQRKLIGLAACLAQDPTSCCSTSRRRTSTRWPRLLEP